MLGKCFTTELNPQLGSIDPHVCFYASCKLVLLLQAYSRKGIDVTINVLSVLFYPRLLPGCIHILLSITYNMLFLV